MQSHSHTHCLIDLTHSHTHVHKLKSNRKMQNPELLLCRLKYKCIVYLLERRFKEWERNLGKGLFSQWQIFTEDRSHMATDPLAKENLVMGFKVNIRETF